VMAKLANMQIDALPDLAKLPSSPDPRSLSSENRWAYSNEKFGVIIQTNQNPMSDRAV
jgi:hypothetical protein